MWWEGRGWRDGGVGWRGRAHVNRDSTSQSSKYHLDWTQTASAEGLLQFPLLLLLKLRHWGVRMNWSWRSVASVEVFCVEGCWVTQRRRHLNLPHPSKPPFPAPTLSLWPYLPPATHKHTHSQTFFFFFPLQSLPCFSSQSSAQEDCFVLLRGCFASRTGPPCWGEAKKKQKKACVGGAGWWSSEWQGIVLHLSPALSKVASVLAFKDCAALLLPCWLWKQCRRITGLWPCKLFWNGVTVPLCVLTFKTGNSATSLVTPPC